MFSKCFADFGNSFIYQLYSIDEKYTWFHAKSHYRNFVKSEDQNSHQIISQKWNV